MKHTNLPKMRKETREQEMAELDCRALVTLNVYITNVKTAAQRGEKWALDEIRNASLVAQRTSLPSPF